MFGLAGAALFAGGVAGVVGAIGAGAWSVAAGGVVDDVVAGSVVGPLICDQAKTPTNTTTMIASHGTQDDEVRARGSLLIFSSGRRSRSGRGLLGSNVMVFPPLHSAEKTTFPRFCSDQSPLRSGRR
ncbi:exported protein of unknown function [Agrobacterium pusense]|uniref:Uncharacterized protein n=1 Tax=Agrobacterium pusense TaxID=648995 RepID=U4Q074_9HYPH|nr:exported protein of unknown function [Agrobacterium pusense]